jgi:hypothetical protein
MRILFSLICLITFTMNAQSQITFDHTSNAAGGFSNEFDIALHNEITNNSDQDTFRWVRKNEVLSPSWESAVCDNIQCHDVIVDSATFILKKGEFFDFIIHFYPYNKTGNGSMEVYVYAINDPSINTTSTFNATIWGLSTSNLTKDASIYPNPAQNILNITTDKKINAVKVYSLTGMTVEQIQILANSNSIDISGLNNGTYIAEINTDAGIVRKKFAVSK